MTEHKTDINFTKTAKYKKSKKTKLNSASITDYKTDMNRKTEQHFYDGTRNRI